MAASGHTITKQTFLNALCCGTKGWYIAHDAGEPPTAGDLLRMKEGQEVHAKARGLFPSGVFAGTVQKTADAIGLDSVQVIFEAAFEVDGYSARADMLQREGNGFRVIEVKSSLHSGDGPKAEHVDDLAYTTMVLRRAGVPVVGTSLLLLSPDWRLGQPERSLFVESDQTAQAFARADEFLGKWEAVAASAGAVNRPAPQICFECRSCRFFECDCVGKGVEDPVFDLPRLSEKKFNELVSLGALTIRDIPADFGLTGPQARVADAVRAGKPVVDQAKLGDLLSQIRWPARYLDFETVKTAIPLWPGVAPHEQVVTQYSVHERDRQGSITGHREYLADPTRDCREELVERLLADLGQQGSIVVYSSFEKTTLNGLATRFPRHAPALRACVDRLFDLEMTFKEAYCHPGFRGKTSIKRTLPVLVPAMSYKALDIGDGDSAVAAFARMAMGETTAADAEIVRRSLLEYCKHDTLAMVKLHEVVLVGPNDRAAP